MLLNRKIKDERELLIEHDQYMRTALNRSVTSECTKGTTTSESMAGLSPMDPLSQFEIKEREVHEDDFTMAVNGGLQTDSFPVAFRRTDQSSYEQPTPDSNGKSVFAREMELRAIKRRSQQSEASSSSSLPSQQGDGFEYLRTHGPQTVSGTGLGFRYREVERIHQENLERLSQLSEAEIEHERELLLSSMDPSMVAFLLHKDRRRTAADGQTSQTEPKQTRQSRSRPRAVPPPSGDIRKVVGSAQLDQLEEEKLEWTRDLPAIARKPPELHVSPGSQNLSDDVEMAEDCNILENKDSKPCQARFDLCGLVVPPEAVLDTHLGLHHHGEEPERAGYTIGELFHLSRSSVPAQRRLALATLAAALGQTRRGRHVHNLAPPSSPSLIWGLLSSSNDSTDREGDNGGGGKGGVAFLLRWCLDESVSSLTSVGAVSTGAAVSAGGHAGGASLGLTVECIRGLANLLCDAYGEAYLNNTFEWPLKMATNQHLFLAPRTLDKKTKIPGVFNLNKSSKAVAEEELDHGEAMALDPVLFLFTKGQLAQRLAWLLSDAKGNLRTKLPPDAVGLWLPALLIRAVRHSPTLAYRVFSVPNLFRTLLDNYLPMCPTEPPGSAHAARPTRLSLASGIPLPAVLLLCRLTMLTSSSIRLAMVNDLQLVERCYSYIMPPASSCSLVQDVDCISLEGSLLSHLPRSLPLKLAVQVQIEALRCLSVCLGTDSSEQIPLHALNYTWSKLPSLSLCMKRVFENYFRHFGSSPQSHTEDVILLPQLLPSWISFLTQAVEALALGSKRITSWSTQPFLQFVDELFSSVLRLLEHFMTIFNCGLTAWEEVEAHLMNHGITANLLGVSIDCVVRLVAVQQQIEIYPTTSPILQRVETLWTSYLLPLFSHGIWIRATDRFIRCKSVLTGVPETLGDVDIVTVPVLPQDEDENATKAKQISIDWSSLPSGTPIEQGILEPVNLAPHCLPDLGARVSFRYRMADPGLSAFVWPKSGVNMEDDCDTLASVPGDISSLSLLACIVSTFERLLLQWRLHLVSDNLSLNLFLPLIEWIRRMTEKRPLPWLPEYSGVASTSASLPFSLMAMESHVLGKAVLLMAQILPQQCSLSVCLRNDTFGGKNKYLLHRTALRLLPLLRGGQKQLLRDLQDEVVFAPHQIEMLLSDTQSSDEEQCLRKSLQVYRTYTSEVEFASSVKDTPIQAGRSYMPTLPETPEESEPDLEPSFIQDGASFRRPALPTRPVTVAASLLPHDWAYAPLIGRYLQAKQLATSGITGGLAESEQQESLSELTVALRWLLFLYQVHSSSCRDLASSCGIVDPLAHLARLCLGCLGYSGAGGLGFGQSGIFLAKLIHLVGPMRRLQQINSRPSSLETVDLPPCCASFYDLYTDLLGHFSALSYNSPVFANLILWPCQQLCHMKYRRALWGEHQHALVAVRLRLDQLLLPLESFLEPEETDESVLRVYASALLSGGVSVDRQPLLFLIAVHHINRYLYHAQNVKSAFVQQFTRLVRSAPPGLDSTRQKPTASLHANVLNVIRLYKQPNLVWVQKIPQLLPDDRLSVGVADPLIVCPGIQIFDPTSPIDFSIMVSNAGIDCYTPDEFPPHRKSFWDRYFLA